MATPIDVLMDNVKWNKVKDIDRDINGDLPYVTHDGILVLGDIELRCYQLSNGQRIFNADDLEEALGFGRD